MNKDNCFREDVLALYVEGDVPQMAAAIETHLRVCAVCRSQVDEFRESQSIFKSLGQESVSPAALAGVRSRVLDEVGRRDNGSRLLLWLGRLAPLGVPSRYALA